MKSCLLEKKNNAFQMWLKKTRLWQVMTVNYVSQFNIVNVAILLWHLAKLKLSWCYLYTKSWIKDGYIRISNDETSKCVFLNFFNQFFGLSTWEFPTLLFNNNLHSSNGVGQLNLSHYVTFQKKTKIIYILCPSCQP